MKDYNSLFENCNTDGILESKKVSRSVENCMFKSIPMPDGVEHPCHACPQLDNYDKDTINVQLSSTCKKSIQSYCNSQISQGGISDTVCDLITT